MKKFVQKSKMSKKARRAENAAGRGNWGDVVPVTRVIPSKKHYTRKTKHKNEEANHEG